MKEATGIFKEYENQRRNIALPFFMQASLKLRSYPKGYLFHGHRHLDRKTRNVYPRGNAYLRLILL